MSQVERLTTQLAEGQSSPAVSSPQHSSHQDTMRGEDSALVAMLQSDLDRISVERYHSLCFISWQRYLYFKSQTYFGLIGPVLISTIYSNLENFPSTSNIFILFCSESLLKQWCQYQIIILIIVVDVHHGFKYSKKENRKIVY